METFNIPPGFDVPDARRPATLTNALWLLRNAAVRNADHPALQDVRLEALRIVRGTNDKRNTA